MEREAKMTLIIGTNGCGKTTILRKILQSSKEKSLVITPDDVEWRDFPLNELNSSKDFNFAGINRHIFFPKTTLERIKFFQRGLLVFDDCRAYLDAATDKEIRTLLIRRRMREVDVFAVGHGFTEIPPVFFRFTSDIILFRTTENIKERKNCIKNFDAVEKIQQRINQKANKEPHYFEVINYKKL